MELTKIQNVKGSLLETIGRTVGVDKFSVTHLRQSAEKILQDHKKMRDKAKAINNHSQIVGEMIYDPSVIAARVQFVNFTEKSVESPRKETVQQKPYSKFEKDRIIRKRGIERADKVAREKRAKKFLLTDKMRRNENAKYSPRLKVLPNHRHFLQKLLYEEMFGSTLQFFPTGK